MLAAVRSALFLVGAAAMLTPALAQQLVPFRIGSQSPPIFEYIYINYAIDGGFLKKEGLDGKFVGFTAGLTSTQALAGGSVDAACDGFTGTVSAIAKHIRRLKPASLRLAALLDRPARREVEVKIDFTGFVIPDRFVIGYGLDYAGLYRELPGIYTLN